MALSGKLFKELEKYHGNQNASSRVDRNEVDVQSNQVKATADLSALYAPTSMGEVCKKNKPEIRCTIGDLEDSLRHVSVKPNLCDRV
ncbi:hypothetical protein V6N12_014648 [Hibiscus sabdariffa]|uniref:Uncharacterized protein n=1 Tax=Hibiscus sabdariffa TaxID=183260 RepID=A0ABR2DKT6_9ROSI